MHDAHGPVPLLQDYLAGSARTVPNAIALVCKSQRVTYRQLDQDANAIAHTLIRGGLTRGDRVLIFTDNTVETVVAFWAVLKAGGVVSIVNPLTKAQKLQYLIDDCTPQALITDAHLYEGWIAASASPHIQTLIVSAALPPERSRALPKAISWSAALAMGDALHAPGNSCIDLDLAAIIYTSGSSGDPKGVMLTHRNMLTAATSISSYLQLNENDVILNVLPLAFDYGLYQMVMAFRQGARLILERSFAYPAHTLSLFSREGVTVFPGVPTIFAMLAGMNAHTEYDLSTVRCVTNTAAALSSKHIDLLSTLFPSARIYSMYGLTECKRCTYLPPEDLHRKPGSVGIAIPNTELWLVDEHDRRVDAGTVGQLVIRGATVMKGYWGKTVATAEKLKPGPVPGELVLYTGDYCRLDADGYLYFIGRMDDIIKCRGEKVAPKEVEMAIAEIPGVKEVAVIGVPDEILGEAIKAFVVLEPQVTMGENDIRRTCQEKLESFMVPRMVVFVEELPKTHTGKITKLSLR